MTIPTDRYPWACIAHPGPYNHDYARQTLAEIAEYKTVPLNGERGLVVSMRTPWIERKLRAALRRIGKVLA